MEREKNRKEEEERQRHAEEERKRKDEEERKQKEEEEKRLLVVSSLYRVILRPAYLQSDLHWALSNGLFLFLSLAKFNDYSKLPATEFLDWSEINWQYFCGNTCLMTVTERNPFLSSIVMLVEVHCWGWPWQILGAICAVAITGGPGEFFCPVNNARFHRFPVGQISRNLNTTR